MATPRVLISDEMSQLAEDKFREKGVEVDVITTLDPLALEKVIGEYDGLAIRSATKATAAIIAAADNLKVIGRAGIGTDNVDKTAASGRGIIVMNTPFGNSVTTAEHAITLMLSLARQIPLANSSTQAGKWEKSRFMGVEVTGKTFGVVGCGNIGANAIERAQGLKMNTMAYDPFLSEERAIELGVKKVTLDELLAGCDFISLHTPMIKEGANKTLNIIDESALSRMKKGSYIINCARGGLVDEAALKVALESGHLAGAALDVFADEPAKENALFGLENVICTPHLGASTTEAQEKVAEQVAEQMADYLLTGAITNAVNFPSISAEEAPKLKPFVALAEQLGSFVGQVCDQGIATVKLEYVGDIADLNTKALTAAAMSGMMSPVLEDVNMVSAPTLAKERGIKIEESMKAAEGTYGTYMRVTATNAQGSKRQVAGTVFSNGNPKVIQVKGIDMEADLAPHMLYTVNSDKPGYIGAIGTLLGENGINIASFNLGRADGEAIALIEIDSKIPDEVMEKVRALPQVTFSRRFGF